MVIAGIRGIFVRLICNCWDYLEKQVNVFNVNLQKTEIVNTQRKVQILI